MRKLGDTITFDFTTHNPSTGAVTDTDTLPICDVFEDANDTAILTPVVTKRVGKTGDYRVSIEATVGNGFEVGKTYNVIAAAAVNTIPAKSRIGVFVLDSKRNADMNDLSQVQIISDGMPFLGTNIDAPISSRSTLTDAQVWGYTTRTLTSFGSLISDIWTNIVRTLTTGTKDTEINLIKAKTDQLTFTVPGQVDATISGGSGGGGLTLEEHNHLMLLDTSGITTLQVAVSDIMGLTGENTKWSSLGFDTNHNLTSAIITQYTDNTLLTERKKWQLAASYNANSELVSYQLKEY